MAASPFPCSRGVGCEEWGFSPEERCERRAGRGRRGEWDLGHERHETLVHADVLHGHRDVRGFVRQTDFGMAHGWGLRRRRENEV